MATTFNIIVADIIGNMREKHCNALHSLNRMNENTRIYTTKNHAYYKVKLC